MLCFLGQTFSLRLKNWRGISRRYECRVFTVEVRVGGRLWKWRYELVFLLMIGFPHRRRSASRTSFFWSSGLPSEPINATGFVLCWLQRKKQFVQLLLRNLKSVHQMFGSSEQTAYFHTLLEKFTQEQSDRSSSQPPSQKPARMNRSTLRPAFASRVVLLGLFFFSECGRLQS